MVVLIVLPAVLAASQDLPVQVVVPVQAAIETAELIPVRGT